MVGWIQAFPLGDPIHRVSGKQPDFVKSVIFIKLKFWLRLYPI
jgi:hypothetical protein